MIISLCVCVCVSVSLSLRGKTQRLVGTKLYCQKWIQVNFRAVQENYYDAFTYNRKLNIKCADQYYE